MLWDGPLSKSAGAARLDRVRPTPASWLDPPAFAAVRIVTLITTPPQSRVAKAQAPPAPPMPGLGWMEWVVIAQTIMPALMYVPGLSALRALTRAIACALPLV